jgi:hypothetical protein
MAGAAANLADVPHEGMCRGAAANAKEGCKQLAKNTAITNTKINNKSSHRLNIHSGADMRFQGIAGQKNDEVEEIKKASEAIAPKSCGSFFSPGLATPHRGARQQSPTPFHQATKLYTTKNEADRFERGTYVQTQKPSRKNCWKPPLDANFSFREVAHSEQCHPAEAWQHSHQTPQMADDAIYAPDASDPFSFSFFVFFWFFLVIVANLDHLRIHVSSTIWFFLR